MYKNKIANQTQKLIAKQAKIIKNKLSKKLSKVGNSKRFLNKKQNCEWIRIEEYLETINKN